jgi:pimeloyl-ACP methyl ester carboxylesterase
MPGSEVEKKILRASSDGTSIAYYDTGGDKPAVILASGLGGPFSAWHFQVDFLREHYRVISWDYRGLYQSARPPGRPPQVDIDYHVSDLNDLISATGVERAALVGWSMGVQVVLALYEQKPASVSHLVLLNGSFGRPFESLAFPFAARWVPDLVDTARRLHMLSSSVLRRASRWPETPAWLKRFGAISKSVDDELLRQMVGQLGHLDLELYFSTLHALGRHDVRHILEQVRVPTLVIAGENDAFTPHRVSQQMARRIKNAEVLIVRGATHYAACEYPELVNLRIEKFFREHGYG